MKGWKLWWHQLHRDESGMEAIQAVLILAIAAVALLVVKTRWEVIRNWFGDLYDELVK